MGYSYSLNIIQNLLDKLMSVPSLMLVIKLMIVLMVLLIISIYNYLSNKKRRYFQLLTIRETLEPLITQIIVDESDASEEQIQALKKQLTTALSRRFMTEELIRCKQNYSGEVADKIIQIYLRLDLKKYSHHKIRPKSNWYIKARGIQELYVMEQKKSYPEIYNYTDASNEFVRNEAQIGMIHLIGFKGLHFLEKVSQPITDWQQLKLMEQLKLFPEKIDISSDIPGWLASPNDTVVVFALKLCYEYQYYQLIPEIKYCLNHNSAVVKTHTVETLIRLENDQTAKILLNYFKWAPKRDQLLILDAIGHLATEEHVEKLEEMLDINDDSIKLKASIAIAHASKSGLRLLEEKSIIQPEPYQRILLHILTES
jgi:hypothetical protein